MWPPSSPNIDPVDYAIWRALQQRVYHQRQFEMVKEPKREIATEWQKLSQRYIAVSMNGVDRRLEAQEWRRRTHRALQLGSNTNT